VVLGVYETFGEDTIDNDADRNGGIPEDIGTERKGGSVDGADFTDEGFLGMVVCGDFL
jgi:hypothetical protein